MNIKPIVVALTLISLAACNKVPECASVETQKIVMSNNKSEVLKTSLIDSNNLYTEGLNQLALGFLEGLGAPSDVGDRVADSHGHPDLLEHSFEFTNNFELTTRKEEKLEGKTYCESLQNSNIIGRTKFSFNKLWFEFNPNIKSDKYTYVKIQTAMKETLLELANKQFPNHDIKNTVTIIGDDYILETKMTYPATLNFTTQYDKKGIQSIIVVKEGQ